MNVIGNADKHQIGRWMNNNAENSHLSFRRRERAMHRFRSMRCLRKFAAVHASVQNHFNRERHLYSRDIFEPCCAAAPAEWIQRSMRGSFVVGAETGSNQSDTTLLNSQGLGDVGYVALLNHPSHLPDTAPVPANVNGCRSLQGRRRIH